MAFKVLILSRKRADLEWQQFVDAYEEHCEWMRERIASGLLAPLVDYRRNYILPGHRLQTPAAGTLDFDVVSEAWFVDEAGLDKNNALASDEVLLAEIAAELSQYVDVASVRYVPVLEFQERSQPALMPDRLWGSGDQ